MQRAFLENVFFLWLISTVFNIIPIMGNIHGEKGTYL